MASSILAVGEIRRLLRAGYFRGVAEESRTSAAARSPRDRIRKRNMKNANPFQQIISHNYSLEGTHSGHGIAEPHGHGDASGVPFSR